MRKRRGAAAAIAAACAIAGLSCVEVTTARRTETPAGAQDGGRVVERSAGVRVFAWNPLGCAWKAVSRPFKAAARGVKKLF